MWHDYVNASSVEEVLQVLAERGEKARIVAGATDLILEMERGVRKGIETLVDISRVPGLDEICLDEDDVIHLGPGVTHNQCVASKLIRERAFPLARACWEVGSPQIRNRGTVAGNIITASPANDTISPLMALGACLTLRSTKGERVVTMKDFYLGVRRTVLQPDEMVVDIAFPASKANQKGTFYKFALRRAQAISLLNSTVLVTFDGNRISKAVITLGAVAPTIIHAVNAETFLVGKELTEDIIRQTGELAMAAARPISDVRGSAGYRRKMVGVVVRRSLAALATGTERDGFPTKPIVLWGKDVFPVPKIQQAAKNDGHQPITTRINGKTYTIPGGQNKTLLRFLREDVGLVGTKEGCAEGECGACTVHLDGVAVMSCMVPAPRAQGAEIVTVEGLAQEGQLHPVQEAFIEKGAVQCGYCTPGFLMSAAKLLEERPTPSQEEIRQAITGNLCRCTGYYKIIEAIETASRR